MSSPEQPLCLLFLVERAGEVRLDHCVVCASHTFFSPRSVCESRKLPIGGGEGGNAAREERRCLY